MSSTDQMVQVYQLRIWIGEISPQILAGLQQAMTAQQVEDYVEHQLQEKRSWSPVAEWLSIIITFTHTSMRKLPTTGGWRKT
ncbi:MAG TPA: hypothetical protein VEL31_14280 [Ktedonobacteraceae bacterium]|nr:hypothetical protein [Ktedonobacteraceae bacterium]